MDLIDDDPVNSFDKELDKSKILNLLNSNLARVKDKSKLLNVLLYVMQQLEIYFNKTGQGQTRKEICIELLLPFFKDRELLEHSIDFILKTNKIFKKKLKNKVKNYFARRALKKKLRK